MKAPGDMADIEHLDRDRAYTLIARTLERVVYPRLGTADKGVATRSGSS